MKKISSKKIVLINGRFLTQRITGVQRYARELLSALTELDHPGYDFVVAVPTGEVKDPPAGVEIIRDSSPLKGALWQQLRLPSIKRRTCADILWSPCNIGPVLAPNHIVTIHDASVFAGPEWFSKSFALYYRTTLKRLGQSAVRIITDSEFSKRELSAYSVAPPEKIEVVHAGISGHFSPSKKPLLDYPYVLTLGSRNPRKNVARLVRGWGSLSAEARAGRRLVIAGGEANSYSSEGLGALSEDIVILKYPSDEDLPALYSGADAFVFPSIYEGFGLPPLEAMACGTAVVSSNAASLPEVCGDAAIYVDPFDEGSIARGIERVLKDDAFRAELESNGPAQAALFGWERGARDTLKVFDHVSAG